VAALGVLAIVLAVWAAAAPHGARAGPHRVGPVDRSLADVPQFSFNTGCGWACLPAPSTSTHITTTDGLAALLGWGSVILVATGGLLCLVVILRALAPLVTRREEPDLGPAGAPGLEPGRVARVVTEGAAERLDALTTGTPEQGVMAAWVHLERSLQDAGVPLRMSRTSSEVSQDVLNRFVVDPDRVHMLAALYRDARWSGHRLTEDHRAAAASAYREIDSQLRSQLRSPVPRGTRAQDGVDA
jgi:hypothetical protein